MWKTFFYITKGLKTSIELYSSDIFTNKHLVQKLNKSWEAGLHVFELPFWSMLRFLHICILGFIVLEDFTTKYCTYSVMLHLLICFQIFCWQLTHFIPTNFTLLIQFIQQNSHFCVSLIALSFMFFFQISLEILRTWVFLTVLPGSDGHRRVVTMVTLWATESSFKMYFGLTFLYTVLLTWFIHQDSGVLST